MVQLGTADGGYLACFIYMQMTLKEASKYTKSGFVYARTYYTGKMCGISFGALLDPYMIFGAANFSLTIEIRDENLPQQETFQLYCGCFAICLNSAKLIIHEQAANFKQL